MTRSVRRWCWLGFVVLLSGCLNGRALAQFGPAAAPPSAAARDAYIRQFRTKKTRDEARATLERYYPTVENKSEVPAPEAETVAKLAVKVKTKPKTKIKAELISTLKLDKLPTQKLDPDQWRYFPFDRGADRGYYKWVSALPGPAINYLTEQYAGQTVAETVLLENPAGRCVWEVTLPDRLVYFTDTGAFLREKRIK